jgi:hypothetical protein
MIWDKYSSSLSLARVYASAPYRALPPANREFVDVLAGAKGFVITDETQILSLLATRGKQPAWNDRRKSKGHVGMPLVSSAFVESMPMLSRLLTDLGVGLEWINRADFDMQTTLADWSGLFYVPDARTTRDRQNRHVIPAQDFVRDEGVRTVFALGGSYPGGTILAMILFTCEDVVKSSAERFMPLTTAFKQGTASLVREGHIFAS